MLLHWKRLSLAAMSVALLGFAATAPAQQPNYRITDSNVQPVGFGHAHSAGCGCETAPSCGCDTAPSCEAPCGDYGCGDVTCGGCDSCGGCDPCASACGGGGDEAWKLFPAGSLGQWDVGGWVSGGIQWDDGNAQTTAPVPFVNQVNEFQMNQAWIYAERATDTSDGGIDFGFRVDYVFGADGPDTQAFGDEGWDFDWISGGNGNYGSAIPQLYGTVAVGDLSVKVGHFYTIMGYEVVPVTGNFFYSHAYTMNYGEPFTHTGVLAEYTGIEGVTLWGGYTDGWDSGWENNLDAATFLGGFSADVSDDITFIYTVNAGNFGDGSNGLANGDIYAHSIVVDVALTDDLNYVFQSDLGINNNSNLPGNQDAEWYGINQYLFYTINDSWKAGGRLEWFRDDDGARIGDAPNGGDFYAATLGLNWMPHANVNIRPEVRYDWYDGVDTPFDGGTANSYFTAGFDAYITY
jgi:hypothetical protein